MKNILAHFIVIVFLLSVVGFIVYAIFDGLRTLYIQNGIFGIIFGIVGYAIFALIITVIYRIVQWGFKNLPE